MRITRSVPVEERTGMALIGAVLCKRERHPFT